jgi:short-subunit dehydrogenase
MTRTIAVITGASTGIGATYVDRLARRGYDVLLVARDAVKLAELASRIGAETGVVAEPMPLDLTVPVRRATLERRLRDDDRIVMLVNNAGMADGGTFIAPNVEQLDAMVQLNVLVPTRLAAAISPRLARLGGGTIINMASVAAFTPAAVDSVYAASKAYVLSLSEALHQELGPLGVRVQAVLPGITRTPIWAKSGKDLDGLPPEMIMDVGDMVDAALAGLDLGETITIPALPDTDDLDALLAARNRLRPNLSLAHPANRYQTVPAAA